MPRARIKRISSKQLQVIVDFMQENPSLIKGKLTSSFSANDRQQKWVELAAILNNDVLGSSKSPDQWRKCWNDQKTSVRHKAARIKERKRNCGGDGSSMTFLKNSRHKEALSSLEKKLLGVIDSVTEFTKSKLTNTETKNCESVDSEHMNSESTNCITVEEDNFWSATYESAISNTNGHVVSGKIEPVKMTYDKEENGDPDDVKENGEVADAKDRNRETDVKPQISPRLETAEKMMNCLNKSVARNTTDGVQDHLERRNELLYEISESLSVLPQISRHLEVIAASLQVLAEK